MKLCLGGMEKAQQHIERKEIKNRTDRPNENHEVADQTDIPVLRLLDVGFVNVVGWNRQLGHVVQQVVQENLSGQHWQERQEQRRACHAEHVAEVRTRAHEQILHHVAKRFSTFKHTVVKHLETGRNKDDISSLTRYIYRRRRRDANIGGMDRRGVINTVAHEAHSVAIVLQGRQNPVLLNG